MKKLCFIYMFSALLAYATVADTALHNYLARIDIANPWVVTETQLKEANPNPSNETVSGTTNVSTPVDTPDHQTVPVQASRAGVQKPPINTNQPEDSPKKANDGGKPADKPTAAGSPLKTTVQTTNTPTRFKPASPNLQPGYATQEMLGYINKARTEKGLSPLSLDNALCQGAYLKSKDMAVNNYFSHNSPTYGSPFDMMKKQGIKYRCAAENIAKNFSVRASHEAFMNSSGHKANILNPDFNKVGLGFYWEGNYLYVTQWFTD